MIKFSKYQIDDLARQSCERFSAEFSAEFSGTYASKVEGELRDFAQGVAEFCLGRGIQDAANIEAITVAHCEQGGTFSPSASTSVILEREGFSEPERVRAYLDALSGERQRLKFEDL